MAYQEEWELAQERLANARMAYHRTVGGKAHKLAAKELREAEEKYNRMAAERGLGGV